MSALMIFLVTGGGETNIAVSALIGLIACVNPHVIIETTLRFQNLLAISALVRACVSSSVAIKV